MKPKHSNNIYIYKYNEKDECKKLHSQNMCVCMYRFLMRSLSKILPLYKKKTSDKRVSLLYVVCILCIINTLRWDTRDTNFGIQGIQGDDVL